MYWENIQGFFDFGDIYIDMVSKYNDALFVEIGTWKGKSAVFMGEQIKDKNIKFYTIDTFEMSESNDHFVLIDVEDLYKEACKNIEPVKEYINIIRNSSHDASSKFEDESIDFLFIDGCHEYDCVKKDLELWYPKIKIGGTIGGHDYTQPCGVKQAVNEFFSSGITKKGTSWLVNKL